jgi:cytochrome c553
MSLGRCHHHRQFRLLNIVLALAIAGGARAVPSMSEGGHLYAPCVPCHQPNAWGSPDGSIPNLAGQQPRYLEKQLTAFRSGARDSTAMQIVAVHPTFSDRRNIRALASYLSDLEANPNPVIGSGEHLRVGQELYAHICAACHGISGRGTLADPVNSAASGTASAAAGVRIWMSRYGDNPRRSLSPVTSNWA